MRKNGFTLVEAIIVIVVIVGILAILIPIMREREGDRLQALANAEPWQVFEFRAEPAKESFAEGETIVIRCEIVNPTAFPLTLPKGLDHCRINLSDAKYLAASLRYSGPMLPTKIAPGKSVNYDVTFLPIGTGVTEARIESGRSALASTPIMVTVSVSIGQTVTTNFSRGPGLTTSAEKLFQSNSFPLTVKECESPYWPTFDELLTESKISESLP